MAVETEKNYENIVKATDNSKYLPLFPKANAFLFNSGNIVSSNRPRKKTNQSSNDEVIV